MITSSDLRELADLSGDAPSSMSEPFRNWLGMGATPGSSQVLLIMSPSQQLYLVLGRLWLYERKPAGEKSLFLPVPDHIPVRPQNRKSQCIFLSAWSGSVAWVR